MPSKKTCAGIISTALLLAGCATELSPTTQYEADITVTEYGIPHIVAANYGSLGFGDGYMAARDHLCNISHIIVRANGELSQYLGAGAENANFISDYAVHGLGLPERYDAGYPKQPENLKAMLEGYAAGFNKYLAEYEASGENVHWCHGADWVKPVTGRDIYARSRYIVETLPRAGGALYAAQPPGTNEETALSSDAALQSFLGATSLGGFGSNAWAIGSDLTETSGGMLLANPHYPWFGSNRFWEKHLTLPGEYDVYGVSLLGQPGIGIGFNKDIAWSHTVSDSQRLVAYQLTLNSNDPLSYLYEDQIRRFAVREFTVPVKGDDGQMQMWPAKMYYSHHGPLVSFPGLEWDESRAFAIRDANRNNDSTLAQWNDMSLADSMESFKAAHEKWNALPWVNTTATSRDGQAVYIDNSTVGYLSDEAIKNWKKTYESYELVRSSYDEREITLLDGSRKENDFIEGAAPVSGTVPYDQRPQIARRDYVFNANDSYWISSPREPMTGFSPLYGPAETARSLRTRMNVVLLENLTVKSGDVKVSLNTIQEAILSNKSMAAKVFLSDLIALCDDHADKTGAAACDALKMYDGQLNIDSKGSVLFREWVFAYAQLTAEADQPMFKIPFSKDDPVNTPAGLHDSGLALNALKKAVALLESAEIPLGAALGDVQVAVRGPHEIPMHGGFGLEGNANLIDQRGNDTPGPFPAGTPYNDYSRLSDKGYLVSGGTSFIMTLAFDENGPTAEAILTYGQSGEPGDENYIDQTKLFAEKKWRPIYFRKEDVRANAVEQFTITGE